MPNAEKSCGPYKPAKDSYFHSTRYNNQTSRFYHDTIGMIAVDKTGRIAGGTSTNGASHKVPGFVQLLL